MQSNVTESMMDTGVAHDAQPGVSWPAIFAGATGAAALSYLLVILGFGLGLSSVSPWTNTGTSAKALGVATIIWLAFIQIAASGMGGFLAGRLRRKWAGVHDDEVFFRDSAHGFLSWAVASLVVVAFLASSVATIISGGAAVAGAAVESIATGATAMGSKASDEADGGSNYFVDTLFRNAAPGADSSLETGGVSGAAESVRRQQMTTAQGTEAARIFAKGVTTGSLPQKDKEYLGQVIASVTGVNQQEAVQRVDAAFTGLQESIETAKTTAMKAADDARKLSANASLWMFVTLLLGALCASFAAIIGGRGRDILLEPATRTYR